MAHERRISLFALVEQHESELCRAKLLPPLSMEVVTSDWHQAKALLTTKWHQHLKKVRPSRWLGACPRSKPQGRKVALAIKPPERMIGWDEGITVSVSLFCWPISPKHFHWYVPHLNASFLTEKLEVSDVHLQNQLRGILSRQFDDLTLSDVRNTFCDRLFEVRKVTDVLVSEVSEKYQTRKVKKKGPSLKTLRSVGTPIARWRGHHVFEYEDYVERMNELLLGEKPTNVLLVGPPGVGKSAIAFEWARQFSLRTHSPEATILDVWATSGARLVSGASGFGMWQQRCLDVVKEVRQAKILLHLGSAVELLESGKINGQPGVAAHLRTSLESGELISILECTPEQITIIQREEPLLLRSFARIDVSAPSVEKATMILSSCAERLSKTHHVHWEDSATDELIRLHLRFATYSSMPGQPLSMLQSMLETWDSVESIDRVAVSKRFSQDTGLPLFLLDDSVRFQEEEIRAQLESDVIGQPEPIRRIVELMTVLKARMNRIDRPLASLLLIGPTGVGKTETAKALAKLLYRDPSRMIRIDMSEYAHPWSGARMIGVNNGGDGTLTSPIRDQPFSVVLLDEFEKSHASVLDLLLQVLGEGRLTDSMGRIADFRNAVILLTSNLGVESFHGRSLGFDSQSVRANEHFLREVKRFVRPEFLGRIDQIIPYQPLAPVVVRKIVDREIDKLAARSGLRYRTVDWSITPTGRDTLAASGYEPAYGARPLKRELERHVAIPIADTMHLANELAVPHVVFDASPDRSRVEMNVRMERLSKRDSFQSPQHRAIEEVRDLGYRARLLRHSSQFYSIQNDLERIRRQIDRSKRRLKQLTSARRKQGVNYQIQLLRREEGETAKSIADFMSIVEQVEQLQSRVLSSWYQNQSLEVDYTMDEARKLAGALKTYLISMQRHDVTVKEMYSVIILCNPIPAAKPLWEAYRRMADLNGWRVLPFRFTSYNSMHDPLSREFLEKQAASRKNIEIPDQFSPAFRLLRTVESSSSENMLPLEMENRNRVKEIDVFRVTAWSELDQLPKSTMGIALQMDNGRIGNWLGEEHGVHHFVGTGPEGNRRVRARVLMHPGRLFDWDPPSGWNETPSLPLRDPRRTYHAGERRLESHLTSHEVVEGTSDPIAAWVDMIQHESDTRLWQSVGYRTIPSSATMDAPLYGFTIVN
jgi:ATP-dependent Clp protease ATP-binding subunit ClpC